MKSQETAEMERTKTEGPPSLKPAKKPMTPGPPLPSAANEEIWWCGLDFYCVDLLKMKREIEDWYYDFWGSDTGGVIILAGGVGAGKTHLAEQVFLAYASKARILTESEFIGGIWSHFKTNTVDNFIDSLRHSFLLILDDIGTVHIRSETRTFIHENYWKLFDKRITPLLITTNLNGQEFSDWIGERANDRLFEQIKDYGGAFVNLFNVPSYRKRGLNSV